MFHCQYIKNIPEAWKLVQKYPEIFFEDDLDNRAYYPEDPQQRVNLRYGFECGAGWFKLIDEYCQVAVQLLNDLRKVHPKEECYIHGCIIKEKFGQLCFQNHISLPPPYKILFSTFEKSIEDKSKNVCELTGKFGVLCVNSTGLFKTLCKKEAYDRGFMLLNEQCKKEAKDRGYLLFKKLKEKII